MDWETWATVYIVGGIFMVGWGHILDKRPLKEQRKDHWKRDMFGFYLWPLILLVGIVASPVLLGISLIKYKAFLASRHPDYELIDELEVKNEISPPAKEEPVCVTCNHRHRTQETHGECYACDCKEVRVYLDDSLVVIEEFKTNEPIFPAFGD